MGREREKEIENQSEFEFRAKIERKRGEERKTFFCILYLDSLFLEVENDDGSS